MEVQQNIVLYSNGCPKCKVLKKKLQQCEIHYSENTDSNKMLEMGFTSVPILKIGGEILNFNEAVQWINNMGVH